MNVAQIIRKALYQIDAVKYDDTTPLLFTERELLTWANAGKQKLEIRLQQVEQDFGLVFRNSTDSAFRFEGASYTPSSMQLSTTGRTYTLPPDLIKVKRIRCITSGHEYREFQYLDMSDAAFQDIEKAVSTDTTAGTLYWDVVGQRTLRIARPPDTALDIEIAYIARTAKLRVYTTGTIALTQGDATVTGTSTEWVIEALSASGDIIHSADSTAPKLVSQASGGTFVDPQTTYSPIDSITSDTALELQGNWLPASISTRGYMYASTPTFPEEHHHIISSYVSGWALLKAGSAGAQSFFDLFESQLRDMTASTAERQIADPEFVEVYDP